MKDNLEEMLRHALTPSDEPDTWLNQHIINSVQKSQKVHNHTSDVCAETEVVMRKSWIKRAPAVALALVLVLGGSLSAYAAWKYMKPEQVASEFGDKKLEEAFLEGDDTNINESQSYGGYTATLLGMVSGENISKYELEDNGEIMADRTYAVLAIEKEDGTPIPDFIDAEGDEADFLVSPLIKGENPNFMNIYCMNGGATSDVKDGIMYKIVDCDNLEAFANRGVYLSVTHTTFYDSEAYSYDEESGEITRNEAYEGLNALFELPLDTSKADDKKAEEQLREWKAQMEGDSEEETEEEEFKDWDLEMLEEDAKLIPETVQTITPDEEGYIDYSYEYKGISGTGSYLVKGIFKEAKTVVLGGCSEGKNGKELIITCTKNDDGTVTMGVYREK